MTALQRERSVRSSTTLVSYRPDPDLHTSLPFTDLGSAVAIRRQIWCGDSSLSSLQPRPWRHTLCLNKGAGERRRTGIAQLFARQLDRTPRQQH